MNRNAKNTSLSRASHDACLLQRELDSQPCGNWTFPTSCGSPQSKCAAYGPCIGIKNIRLFSYSPILIFVNDQTTVKSIVLFDIHCYTFPYQLLVMVNDYQHSNWLHVNI